MAERTAVDLMVNSFLASGGEHQGVDVAISFDTTGSMYGALKEVRARINQTVQSLLRDITNIRFAVIAHGDYCDGRGLLRKLDFSKSPKEIEDFVNNAPPTAGGDWPEAYEYVLREAKSLNWNPEHAKALIMIGDAPPHPPSYTTDLIWWRDEVEALYRFMGVRIYAVQAYESRTSEPFWREIARKSGGVYLRLENFTLMTDMFRAVCYQQAGKEDFDNFAKSLNKPSPELIKILKSMRAIDEAPAALGDYDMEWWNLKFDRGNTYYKPNFNKTGYDHTDNKQKNVRLNKSRLDFFGQKLDEAPIPTESLRTGTSLLEKPKARVQLSKEDAHLDVFAGKPKPKSFAEKEEEKLVLRKIKNGIFELVDRTKLSAEDIESFKRDEEEAKETKMEKERREALEKEIEQPGKPVETLESEAPLLASADVLKAAAVKRIMKDLAEIKEHPIHNIAAEPNGDNLFEWHGNMAGPSGTLYDSTIFHFVLRFPENYPNSPPNLTLGSEIFHPNVFGRWICLDILELGNFAKESEKNALFTGWSTGYSASTILIQLQAFLFEGAIQEPKLAEESCRRARKFVCNMCGHNAPTVGPLPPLPVLPDPSQRPREPESLSKKKKSTPKPRMDFKEETTPVKTESKAALEAKQEEAQLVANRSDLKLGMCVKGTVQRVRNELGAFVQITSGDKTVGLLHKTNVPGSSVAAFKPSQELKLWVVDLDEERVGLSAVVDPLERLYRIQSRVDFGQVKVGDVRVGKIIDNATGGFIVDVDVGTRDTVGRPKKINGYLHISEASADCEVGRVIQVTIEDIDLELGRLKLTCREEGEECSTIADKLADSIVMNVEEGVKKTKGPKVSFSDLESSLDQSILNWIPMEVMFEIMGNLNPIDLVHLGQTCRFFSKVIEDGHSYLWERKEMVCFHSKVNFTDAVLGVGLNLEIKQFNNQLAYITSTFDLLSHESFELEGVRKASWKEPFTHWIPLCINNSHFYRALPLIKSSISKICTGNLNEFSPLQVLEVLPKLMNSFVVQAMSGRLTASIMALEGYSAFHHLFISLIGEFPEIAEKVESTIELFLKDEKSRHKSSIPTLGEWIVLLSVSQKYSWKDVAVSYLMENFDRNVLWTLKAFPHLHVPSRPENMVTRLGETWSATQVSNRLLMFHVYFLRNVARPPGISLEQTRQLLDSRYGRPTFAMKERLLKEVKRIHQVNTWDHFFTKIGLFPPSEQLLFFWLHDSLFRSSRRRYHRRDQFTPEYLAAVARAEKEAARIPAAETTQAAIKKKRATVVRDDDDKYYDKLHTGRGSGYY